MLCCSVMVIIYTPINKLGLNTEKTKFILFSKSPSKKIRKFDFQNKELETISNYNYLGLNFFRSGLLSQAGEHALSRCNRPRQVQY